MAERGRPRAFDRDTALRRAMEVFWARGYEGTSISDLTAAMGINSPSLYAAFGCKEALFRESVGLYGAVEGAAAMRALAEAPTARAAIAAMLRANVEMYADPKKPPGCMIVLSAAIGAPENTEIRAFLAQVRDAAQETLRHRLERGIADGDLPRGTDTAAMAAFYSTVLNGLSIQSRDGASRDELLSIVDCAMAAWDGLVARRATG